MRNMYEEYLSVAELDRHHELSVGTISHHLYDNKC